MNTSTVMIEEKQKPSWLESLGSRIEENLPSKVAETLSKATRYAFDRLRPDGHWCGELLSNITCTAEHVMFRQAIGVEISPPDKEAFKKWLLSQQGQDGSWTIAPDYPGDVSTSSEAYLALKILGVPTSTPEMKRAREFVSRAGGVAKVRNLSRIYFAQLGLYPWDAIPQLPAELMLMPSASPINIYTFASWARSAIVPLLILRHHRPIYALPNGKSAENDYLDELWVDPKAKMPPSLSLYDSWQKGGLEFFFVGLDKTLSQLGGLRWLPLRGLARRQCVSWILSRQEGAGDWAGIIPPMHASIQALLLEGFKLEDPSVRHGLAAIERFAWQDEDGKRIQACVSPVWDTVLLARGLCDAGNDRNDPRLQSALDWCKARQQVGLEGDWRIYNNGPVGGGYAFEYNNTWYPDVDDTAAAILAFIVQDPKSISTPSIERALEWNLNMQNHDGGFAAFDLNNDKMFLNKIPFCDMNNLCDPSTADVTGRVLESFGLTIQIAKQEFVDPSLLKRIHRASERAIEFLFRDQEADGSWYGRWGVNYIYGTSNVLCGLQYFAENHEVVRKMMDCGVAWLKSKQKQDGSWGEGLQTYKDPSKSGHGPSTPSQTAWALMALLARLDPHDDAIERGVSYMVRSQDDIVGEGASWKEPVFTATGFPEHFYLAYDFYRHCFPLMALGRYLKATRSSSEKQLVL